MGTRDVPAADLSLEESMVRIEDRFKKIDTNGDGKVDKAEFTKLLPTLGLKWDKPRIDKTMQAIDANGDGVINLTEFKSACYMAALRNPDAKIDALLTTVLNKMATKGPMDAAFLAQKGQSNLKKTKTRETGLVEEAIESRIQTKWEEIDSDMDGLIDQKEFVKAVGDLGLNWSEQKINDILSKIGGGKTINFQQFKLTLMAAAQSNPKADIATVFKTTLVNLATKNVMNAGFRENKVKRMMSAMQTKFDAIDENKDNKLNLEEFTKAIKQDFEFDWDDAQIAEVLKKIDLDGNGTIERNEFTRVFYASALSNPDQDIQEIIGNALRTMAAKGGVSQQLSKGMPKLKKVESPGEAKTYFEDDVMTRISQKFYEIDADRDGALNVAEFSQALKDLGLKWHVKTIMRIMGQLGDGKEISYMSFRTVLDSACHANPTLPVDDILKMTLTNMVNKANLNKTFNNEKIKDKTKGLEEEFKKRDTDGNGTLSLPEFGAACAAWGVHTDNPDAVKQLLAKIDTDRSGDISLVEFRRAFSLAVSKNPNLEMSEAIKVTLENMANKGGLNAAFKGMSGDYGLKKRKTRVRSLEENAVSKIATKFKEMDSDGDGALSIKEFADGIQKMGLKWPDYRIRGVLRKIDKDGSGDISFAEFAQVLYAAVDAFPTKDINDLLSSTLENFETKSVMNAQFRENKQKTMLDKLNKKFEELDANKDGQLDPAEFRNMILSLGLGWSEDATDAALKKMDADKSGTISSQEFRSALYMACMRNSDTGIDEILEAVLNRMQSQGQMNYQLGENFPELKPVKKKEASKAEEDAISKIEQAFYKIDLDKNGLLSPNELAVVSKTLDLNWDEKMCEEIIADIDLDGTGQLNMFDFSHVLANAAQKNPTGTVNDIMKDALQSQARTRKLKAQMRANSLKQKLKAMTNKFKALDENNDGKLDLNEFATAVKDFGLDWSDKEIKECLEKIDADKNGTIERAEFQTAFYAACMKNPDLAVDEIVVAALNQMMNKGALNQSFAAGFSKIAGSLKKTKTKASAPFMSEGIISQIEAKFMSMDVDLDGMVSADEMTKALIGMGLKWEKEKVTELIGKMSGGKDVVKFADFKPILLETAERHQDWTIDQVLRTALTNLANKGDVNRAVRSRSVSKE